MRTVESPKPLLQTAGKRRKVHAAWLPPEPSEAPWKTLPAPASQAPRSWLATKPMVSAAAPSPTAKAPSPLHCSPRRLHGAGLGTGNANRDAARHSCRDRFGDATLVSIACAREDRIHDRLPGRGQNALVGPSYSTTDSRFSRNFRVTNNLRLSC